MDGTERGATRTRLATNTLKERIRCRALNRACQRFTAAESPKRSLPPAGWRRQPWPWMAKARCGEPRYERERLARQPSIKMLPLSPTTPAMDGRTLNHVMDNMVDFRGRSEFAGSPSARERSGAAGPACKAAVMDQ